MTDNLLAVAAAVLAAAAVVFAILFFRERSRRVREKAELKRELQGIHADAMAELETSHAVALAVQTAEAEEYSRLAELMEAALASGEAPVFVHAKTSDGRVLAGKAMDSLPDAVELKKLLNFEETSFVWRGREHSFTAQRSGEGIELLLLRDESAQRDLDSLRQQNEADERRRDNTDRVTGAMKPAAFLEEAWKLFDGSEPQGVACGLYLDSAYGRKMHPGVAVGTGEAHLRDLAEVFEALGDKLLFTRCDEAGIQGFLHGYDNFETLHAEVCRLYAEAEAVASRRAPAGEQICRIALGVAWYPTDSTSLPELLDYARCAALDAADKGVWGLASYCDETPRPPIELSEPVDKRLAKVLLQPIVSAADAKPWGYELCLRSRNSAFPTAESLYDALDDEGKRKLEKLMWFEGVKNFVGLLSKGLVPYSARLLIPSTPGVILSDADARDFEERYYDYLDKLVIQVNDGGRGYYSCAEIKSHRAAAWGAGVAVELSGDERSDALARIMAEPVLIRAGEAYIRGIARSAEKQQALSALINDAALEGKEFFVSDIETAAELKAAVRAGAQLLQGAYIAKPEAQPAELTEKRIRDIGEARYGQ